MTTFIFAQIVGFVGLALIVASFQKDKRSFTLTAQLFAGAFFTLHFCLLGAWTGAAMNAVASCRAYVFILRDSKDWINKSVTMYLFIALFWIATLATWKNAWSLLPAISMTLECVALWSTRTRRIRWIYLSARPGWLTYDYVVKSYAGVATEVFIVASVVLAMIRFDTKKKKDEAALSFAGGQ